MSERTRLDMLAELQRRTRVTTDSYRLRDAQALSETWRCN
jgi:hypothetical protein